MSSAPAQPHSLHGDVTRATGTPRRVALGRVPGAGKALPEGGR